jgi:hypothetical protein
MQRSCLPASFTVMWDVRVSSYWGNFNSASYRSNIDVLYVDLKQTHRWYASHRLRDTSLKDLWGHSCWTKKKRKVYNSEAENTRMNLAESGSLCVYCFLFTFCSASLFASEKEHSGYTENVDEDRSEEGQNCLKEGRKWGEKTIKGMKKDGKKEWITFIGPTFTL